MIGHKGGVRVLNKRLEKEIYTEGTSTVLFFSRAMG